MVPFWALEFTCASCKHTSELQKGAQRAVLIKKKIKILQHLSVWWREALKKIQNDAAFISCRMKIYRYVQKAVFCFSPYSLHFFPQVPIKWMALESILNRTYTHQSDVWSYGKYHIYLIYLWTVHWCHLNSSIYTFIIKQLTHQNNFKQYG